MTEAEEFRISSDIKQANLEVLRGRLELAEHYLAYFVDNEENHEENLAQRHMIHEEARQFIASQHGKQATSAETARVHPEQAEDDIKKLIVLLRHGDAMPGEQDLAADHLERLLKAEQAEGALGKREACSECSDTGKVYDVSGEGPWSCYACANKPEVIGYVNGDELDNMLDDRTAVLSPVKTGSHTVPVYRQARAALAQPSPAPELERHLQQEVDIMRIQRDAAQARVAELEQSQGAEVFLTLTGEISQLKAKLEALETQQPLAWVDESWIAQVSDPRGVGCTVRRAYGSAGVGLAPLYAAPVAQAGQVPEQCGPGIYAIHYLDNWDGQGDRNYLISEKTADGRWLCHENGSELLQYKGDAILSAWLLAATTDQGGAQ